MDWDSNLEALLVKVGQSNSKIAGRPKSIDHTNVRGFIIKEKEEALFRYKRIGKFH